MNDHSEQRLEMALVIPEDWENNGLIPYEDFYAALEIGPEQGPELARRIAAILEGIIQANEGESCIPTPFQGQNVPSISLEAYATRIVQHSMCSMEAYIIAIIYMDRYHKEKAGFSFKMRNVYR